MRYLATYTVDNFLPNSEGWTENRPHGHSLIVNAENKIEAFINLYMKLVSQGHMVKTFSGEVIRSLHGNTVAGLSSDEMEAVYKSGIPKINQDIIKDTAMTHIIAIETHEYGNEHVDSVEPELNGYFNVFVDESIIQKLSEIESQDFDLTRLIELCKGLNLNYHNNNHLVVAMIIRSIMNHIPPIFNCKNFNGVANNYKGESSFKGNMQHLQTSFKHIGDSASHSQIKKTEILPTPQGVNFSQDIEVLLIEIITILS